MKKKDIFKYFLTSTFLFFMGLSVAFAETYHNFDSDTLKSCGGGYLTGIPKLIPQTVSIAYTVIQISIPIVLVIVGSIDLLKGITTQKEEDIKKGQKLLVKRLIYAAVIFFIFSIVKIIVSVSADNQNGILECAECFIKNVCD